MILPRLALSVRQPWAHALAMGWKDIENRSWRVINSQRQHVGAFAIHASKGMTRDERGGIVGVARVVEIVKSSDSPWFFGPKGIVIADARPVDFIPAAGALDFFPWWPAGEGYPPPPARWMLPAEAKAPKQLPLPIVDDRQGRLL